MVTLLPAVATAALLAWGAAHLQLPSGPAWLVVVAVALLAALLAWRRARPQALLLAWDGQRWTADGCAGDLDVMIDLGPWMLLRLRPADTTRRAVWIPVSVSATSMARHALRAAVYCRAGRSDIDALSAERDRVKAD